MPFLHIITGPRQTGKTTAARQVAEGWAGEVHVAAADTALPPGPEWVRAQWEIADLKRRNGRKVLLILDEVQKVRGWSESVKALWDRDAGKKPVLRVILLGSSALLVQKGLSESLAGRFMPYRCGHWGWGEMRGAFGWGLEDWLFFGGYPGAARLKGDPDAWARYVSESLVETVLARDVLQMSTVAKPALLRHLFALTAAFPAQILSYNKMLGQLQDAGNTTTLAHYLRLLEAAFLVSGLERFTGGKGQKRGSSPKLVAWNNALVNALRGDAPAMAREDRAWRGRLIENAAGAHLLNGLEQSRYRLFYWRQGDLEVDYVLKTPKDLWAIEIKSGRAGKAEGIAQFLRLHPQARPLIVGPGGLALEEFFMTPAKELFGARK
jgi:hypothetical protein